MQHTEVATSTSSSLDGLWVLLVNDDGQAQIPMMARAGDDQTYLLGFKNMHNARKFLQDTEIEDAEPRMVVKGNRGEMLSIARANGVVGVLVDYNPLTQEYRTASELY